MSRTAIIALLLLLAAALHVVGCDDATRQRCTETAVGAGPSPAYEFSCEVNR